MKVHKKSKLAVILISFLLVFSFFFVGLKSGVLAEYWDGWMTSWYGWQPGGPDGTTDYSGGADSPPTPPNEARIYIYGSAGYYAVNEQQCDSTPIINNTIDVVVNQTNLNNDPWNCNNDGLPYFSFSADSYAGSVFDIYPPIGTSCDEVKIVVPGYGCVIFRRSSGSTCIQEGSCIFSPFSCDTVLSRLSPNWSTNRCIINAPFFVADASVYAKTSAIPTPTPIPPTPTPTPPLCPTGIINSPSDNVCLGPPPTLSASYNSPANTIEFVTYGTPIGFIDPWSCSSGWQSGTSSSDNCAPFSGDYVWGIKTKNTSSSVCRVPDPFNVAPTRRIRIDADAPTHTQATASYNAGTKQITFSWSSSDVGCGACSSKACQYWLQGKWTDEISGEDIIPWPINIGRWTPASYISPSYTGFSCTGHEGLTAKLLIRRANDNIPNYSPDLGDNFSIAGTFTCPAPPPSLGSLYIDADGIADSVKGETYGFSGSRDDDNNNPYYIKGSNSYNYMVTSQEVDSNISGSVENIGLSGVIFATTSEPTSLSDAKDKVKSNDGFIALFANKNVTVAGKSFIKNQYYYYAKNSSGDYVWINRDICKPLDIDLKIKILARDTTGQCDPNEGKAALSPFFKVTLYKGLTASENRKYGTYAYAYDYYNGDEIMASKDPIEF